MFECWSLEYNCHCTICRHDSNAEGIKSLLVMCHFVVRPLSRLRKPAGRCSPQCQHNGSGRGKRILLSTRNQVSTRRARKPPTDSSVSETLSFSPLRRHSSCHLHQKEVALAVTGPAAPLAWIWPSPTRTFDNCVSAAPRGCKISHCAAVGWDIRCIICHLTKAAGMTRRDVTQTERGTGRGESSCAHYSRPRPPTAPFHQIVLSFPKTTPRPLLRSPYRSLARSSEGRNLKRCRQQPAAWANTLHWLGAKAPSEREHPASVPNWNSKCSRKMPQPSPAARLAQSPKRRQFCDTPSAARCTAAEPHPRVSNLLRSVSACLTVCYTTELPGYQL